MNKKGFTVIEFLICVTIMFIVLASSVHILFKKAQNMERRVVTSEGERICSCNEPSRICDFVFTDADRVEFPTIQIVGGGSAGGNSDSDLHAKGGSAGEGRIVHYPSLNGKYRVVLGQGGRYNSSLKNGGYTAIYKEVDGKYKLLEAASGGIYSNEEYSNLEWSDILLRAETAEAQAGELSSISASCGAGGRVGRNGQNGEIVIKW